MRPLLIILALLATACSRPEADRRTPAADRPEPTTDSRQPAPALEGFVITLGPGERPLTARVREHRVAFTEPDPLVGSVRVDLVVDLCDEEALGRVLDRLARALDPSWETATREYTGKKGTIVRCGPEPVTIRLAGRVDHQLVNEVLVLLGTGVNPVTNRSCRVRGEHLVFRDIRIVQGDGAVTRHRPELPIGSSMLTTDLHVVIRPRTPGDRNAKPQELDERWLAAPDDRALMHIGPEADPLPLDPELVPLGGGPVQADYLATLKEALRRQGACLEGRADAAVVIHVFEPLPWRYTALAMRLMRQLHPRRRIHLEPTRLRIFCRWHYGNAIWELMRTKAEAPRFEQPPEEELKRLEQVDPAPAGPPPKIQQLDVEIEELDAEDPEPLPRRRPPLREGL